MIQHPSGTGGPPATAPQPSVPPAVGPLPAARDAGALPVWRSEDVLAGHRAVEIVHAGVRYRLSVTSLGKLILTK